MVPGNTRWCQVILGNTSARWCQVVPGGVIILFHYGAVLPPSQMVFLDQNPFLLPAGVQWIEPMEEEVDEIMVKLECSD